MKQNKKDFKKIIFAQNHLKSCSLTQIFKNLKTAPKIGKRMKNQSYKRLHKQKTTH